jgi:hypothetical protein
MVPTAQPRSLLLAVLVLTGVACSELPPEPPVAKHLTAFTEADDEGGTPELTASALTTTPNTDKQFVWPVSGWIGATSTYYDGSTHLGSADIVANIGTPIMAARGGTVIEARWIEMPRSGWVVKISHGNGVVTKYSHMIRPPKVITGAIVRAGSVLGYSGRTGRAPYPHVHFAIEHWTDAVGNKCDALACVSSIKYASIDLLTRGGWVTRGKYIRGEYGLTATTQVTSTTTPSSGYRVKVIESNLKIYGSSALNTTPSATPATTGARYTVYDEVNGALKIDPSSQRWIAASGTVPAPAEVDWVEPTWRRVSGSQSVRSAPSSTAPSITTLASGTIVRVVGTHPATAWYRALVRNPAKDLNEFGYLDPAAAVSRPTSDFQFRGIVDGRGTSIRTGPAASYAAVTALTANVNTNAKTVRLYPGTVNKGGYRVYNGWYQTGTDQWIAGWKANAPQ